MASKALIKVGEIFPETKGFMIAIQVSILEGSIF
jgi:hypothetical protein